MMKLYKTGTAALLEHEGAFYHKAINSWDELINRPGLYSRLLDELPGYERLENGLPDDIELQAPIGSQEIWAAGVTYMRSMEARMEESKTAGGGTFYDRVYNADRPELFFKAMAARTAGPGGSVNIRRDSGWDVPEPELTLFMSSSGSIEGYTVGNDMSSRSIEGENPLYLPQAKVYDGCAGLGPCILVTEKPLPAETEISLEIRRGENTVFTGKTSTSRIKRSFLELRDFLFRECSFPAGCFLMTGTGIIPPDNFSLAVNDQVRISITGIGTLVNYVSKAI